MQVFDDGQFGVASNITQFTTPYAVTPSSHTPQCSLGDSPLSLRSLTAILVSHFLVNLQQANLRSVKFDSDDPLYFSTHAENSLPSFVAASGAAADVTKTSLGDVHLKAAIPEITASESMGHGRVALVA